MTKKEELQQAIAVLLNAYGGHLGITQVVVEEDDTVIDVRYKGELITIQIN